MKTLRWWVLIVGLLVLAVGLVQAQDDDDACPVVVQSALDLAGDVCGETGRNEICYGNSVLDAEPQDWIDALALDGPGDIEDVAGVRRVRLSSMNTAASEWGIALMRLQANLPDTLPGQNVLFVLFGDVAMESAVPSNAEPLTRTVEAYRSVYLRHGPSPYTPVVGGLAAGDEVIADGISEDGAWLRVRKGSEHAWVSAELVTADGDMDVLDVVQAGAEPTWTPMQAFYLQTGLRDSACTEAPASGLLVQTPLGAETVTFRVNEVDIALGSTAYLQAGDELRVAVVEGQAEVTAFDITRTVPAGAQVFVPLDANGVASGPPGLPEAYEAEDVAALPVPLLDEAVVTAAPLTAPQLIEASLCEVTPAIDVNLREGPGSEYPVLGALAADTGQQAVEQAQGTDGSVWWRLESGRWVSADVVEEAGPCNALTVVEPPPVPVAATCGVFINTPHDGDVTNSSRGTEVNTRVFLTAGTEVNMSITLIAEAGGSGYEVYGPYGTILMDAGMRETSTRSFTAEQDGWYTIIIGAGGGPNFAATYYAEAVCQ